MASTSEEAIRLQQALSQDELQKKNIELEASLQDLLKKNSSLQTEVEKERLEREQLSSAKSIIEKEKREAVEKLDELRDTERLLRERHNATLEALTAKRESLNKAKEELNTLRQREITKSFEVETITVKAKELTTAKQGLEVELSQANSKIDSITNQIRALQKQQDNLREDARSERSRLMEKINDLEKEKKQYMDQVDQLRLQLEHARIRVIEAEERLTELKKSRDQLELNLGSTTSAYKELQKIYTEFTADSHKKLAASESKIASINSEKERLEDTNKDLERKLQHERELRKVQFSKLTGVAEETDNDKPASGLLKLIQDYQRLNRHPEDIFQDFFELREKYNNAVSSNTNLSNMVENLSRKQHESDTKFSRLYREMKTTQEKNNALTASIKAQEAANKQITDSKSKLQMAFDDLKSEKESLAASLNDTTYQLQYLLSEVQRRDEPVPSSLQETASLLNSTQIVPNLPHKQLVYNNVAELQDANKNLVMEVRNLTEKLRLAENEISSSKITRTSDIELYKNALEEAKQTALDLSDKTKQLQKQLDTTTVECENYKKIIHELGDGDATTKFEQMKEIQVRQREEMDITLEAYRKETLEEINKLKEELSACRESDREARFTLTTLNAEKRSLLQKIENLTNHSQRIEQDMKTSNLTNNTLTERIVQRDQEIAQIKQELAEFKSRVEVLREENISLKARNEATESAYKDLKESISRESAEKTQMTSLLDALKSRMDAFSNSGKETNEQSIETIERLTRELQYTRDTLSTAEKQLDYYKSIDQSEIQDKYKESVVEVRLLKTKITEIEQKLSDVNQERIIAQTKLVAAEEQLKKATSAVAEGDTSESSNVSCDEHVRLLAEAEDRIRVLEGDIETYHATIAENDKKADALAAEHAQFVNQTQETINKLLKDLEDRTAAVSVIQNEAQAAIAEYKALHEKSAAAQAEVVAEKNNLEEKIKELSTNLTTKQEEVDALKLAVDTKTTCLTEVESKLEAESKIAEEQRQTINTLRSDVSNLTFEISQYKATIASSAVTEANLKSELEREVNEKAESDEKWKQKLAALNKQHEELTQTVSDLVAKHAEWAAANDKENGPERSDFSNISEDIIRQLREANTTLRIEKDACETNYQNERNKLRRTENELDAIKTQVATLRSDIARIRDENKALKEKEHTESNNDKMQYEAFKLHNQMLLNENKELREAKQKALVEQAKAEAELSPLQLKISTLEAQLEQANTEIQVLTKSQKEWTARSAKLLSKYNRVDPAEIDNVKAELETTKAELETAKSSLETLKTEKATIEADVQALQAKVSASDSEKSAMITKINERGRLAMDFKKKWISTTQQLKEAKEKLEESTKKTDEAHGNTASKADMQKLAQEKEALEAQKKAAEEAKTELEAKLKKETEAHAILEKKYASVLQRARQVQLEKHKVTKELETLKNEKPDASASTAKTAELEKELADVRKQLNESSVELNRYKAQTSMAQNKSNRLQKELDALKALKAPTTLSANAAPFHVSSPVASPRADVKSPVANVAQTPKSPIMPAKAQSVPPKSPVMAARAIQNKRAANTPEPTSSVNTPTSVAASTPTAAAATTTAAVETPKLTETAESAATTDMQVEEPTAVTEPETTQSTDETTKPEETPKPDEETHKPTEEASKPTEEASNSVDEVSNSVEEAPKPIEDEEATKTVEESEVTETVADAVEADLSMEVDTPAGVDDEKAEETEDLDNTTEDVTEDPVDVEVHELENDKPKSPVDGEAELVGTPVPVDIEEEGDKKNESASVTEEDAVAEDVERELNNEQESVETGVKREREEDEEEDLSGTQSPTKKAHIESEE